MTEPDTAAAELALGVLDGAERAAALRRLVAEPDFAREVEQWRNHFALLFAGVAEVPAPEGVWPKVEQLIGERGVVAMPTKRESNMWKPAALAASIAALVMTAVVFRPVEAPPVQQPPTAPSAQLVAAMALTDKSAPQPAFYDADSGTVKMPGPMPIPNGRSAQLWAIEGDNAPRPLGTFREAAPGVYVADARMGAAIAAGATLAISIEPIGGSPTGAPTGPIIASGTLTKV